VICAEILLVGNELFMEPQLAAAMTIDIAMASARKLKNRCLVMEPPRKVTVGGSLRKCKRLLSMRQQVLVLLYFAPSAGGRCNE
jgi:hypothetical protein